MSFEKLLDMLAKEEIPVAAIRARAYRLIKQGQQTLALNGKTRAIEFLPSSTKETLSQIKPLCVFASIPEAVTDISAMKKFIETCIEYEEELPSAWQRRHFERAFERVASQVLLTHYLA